MTSYSQWSSLGNMLGTKPAWVSDWDAERIAAYLKYDQMYWNDPTQFTLRTLEGEQPVYIPNARKVVDTTASFLLKGLKISVFNDDTKRTQAALDQILDREMFYPNFHTAKHAGVTRGDYYLYIIGDPRKPAGKRLTITTLDPSMVFPIYEDDDPGRLIGYHLVQEYLLPDNPHEAHIRRMTYRILMVDGKKRISSEEAIYKVTEKWWGPSIKPVKVIMPPTLLDPAITSLPVYGFKNRAWDGELYGSSELRGLEALLLATSQVSTDVNTALALEGLGVYATDGGRPVNDQGVEVDWEISPGRVMEVPSGAYFRRVEGIKSVTPVMDHVEYLEEHLMEAAGITSIALGQADVAIAQSGIAMAIKFMPTLAKVEERETWAMARLRQFFYDWKIWHLVYEQETLQGDVIPELGDKLPVDRTSRLTELNNMIDRRVISRAYYRQEAAKMGYTFPEDIDGQIELDIAMASKTESQDEENSEEAPGSTLPPKGNQSNNKARPNESSGTEATQSLEDQAKKGGKP